MFVPRLLFLALFLLSLSALLPQATYAQATTPAATPATPTETAEKTERKFTLSYQDNLLSFREDGKAFLFAKTLTGKTVDLHMEIGKGRDGCKVTLRDERGKVLWADTLSLPDPDGKMRSGSFGFNAKMHEGLSLIFSASAAEAKTSDSKSSKGVLTATLRSDNSMVKGEMVLGEDHFRMELLKDDSGMVMSKLEDGKWREVGRFQADPEKQGVVAVVDGQEVVSGNAEKGLVLNDGNGPVTIKSVTVDGKDYTEVQIGDRRLLIAGGNFSAVTKDGAVIITTTPVPPTTASSGTK